MNVSVFGLGYVGCVTAACLAAHGHDVIGVDINEDKVRVINACNSPIVEPGLAELIRSGSSAGKLRATHNAFEAAEHGNVLFVCVGTPSNGNGSLDFQAVDRVCTDIGYALRSVSGSKVIAVRSTLLPGTIRQHVIPLLETASGRSMGVGFRVAVTPEFLREGTAIADFEHPPYTILGTFDEETAVLLEQIFCDLPAPVVHCDPDTASIVKYASNAFHATKIVFANEIGQLCKQVGIDGKKVMEIFCQDSQLNISSRYLRPGFAFGGSCLPKDLRALLYLGRHADLHLPLLESVLPSNRSLIQKVAEVILNSTHHASVGVIGLAFKSGTDDLRESPVVELVETLSGKGLAIRIYDENVALSRLMGGNKAFLEQRLPHVSKMMCNSLPEVVSGAEVVVVSHALPDGGEQLVRLLRPNQTVIDLVGSITTKIDPALYEGICW